MLTPQVPLPLSGLNVRLARAGRRNVTTTMTPDPTASAVVQVSPVVFDRERTLEKVRALARKAAGDPPGRRAQGKPKTGNFHFTSTTSHRPLGRLMAALFRANP